MATCRMLCSKWMASDLVHGWRQRVTQSELDGEGKMFSLWSAGSRKLIYTQNKQAIKKGWRALLKNTVWTEYFVHRQSSRCQQMLQVMSRKVIFSVLLTYFSTFQNQTTNKPSNNVFPPPDSPQHLSSPSSITPWSPSLRPGSIFSSLSRQLCPISSHLFSLVQCN